GAFHDSDIRRVFEIGRDMQAGTTGPSTYSLPTILGNIANKMALAGFTDTMITWNKFCRTRPANDFKTMTNVRLLSIERLVPVAPGGEIKHTTLVESSFTNQIKTYARILGLSRTDFINDDLGMFATIPTGLGRSAAVTLERLVYELLLSNPSSF